MESSTDTGTTSEFDAKLLGENNPFPYPEPPHRPPFMVGGGVYIEWFERCLKQSLDQGYVLSYIVGDPGAGKSHFINHLDYLFNEKKSLAGLYTIYPARTREFQDADLWRHFLTNPAVMIRIKELLAPASGGDEDKGATEGSGFQTPLGALISGKVDPDSIDDKVILRLTNEVSRLLSEKKLVMCLAVDNVDEHFRYLSEKYGSEKALGKLLGTIRSAVTGLDHAMIMLCCTTSAYQTIQTTATDRTMLRRMRIQEEVLGSLSLSQCLELVSSYIGWWAAKNGVKAPNVSECMTGDSDQALNIYPFTPLAIQYLYKMTNHNAGDIVAVCGEIIQLMKSNGRVAIVKDEDLIIALEIVTKALRPIVLKPPDLAEDRELILEKKLGYQLERMRGAVRDRYKHGIDATTMINSIEGFVRSLNIVSDQVRQVPSFEDPSIWIGPDPRLRIWAHGNSHICVKYLIRPSPVEQAEPADRLSLNDVVEMASQIMAGKATHGLFILKGVSPHPQIGSRADRLKGEFSPIVDFRTLSDDEALDVIALAGLPLNESGDLRKYFDRFRLHLSETLSLLVERRMPTAEELRQQRQREHRVALREF